MNPEPLVRVGSLPRLARIPFMLWKIEIGEAAVESFSFPPFDGIEVEG